VLISKPGAARPTTGAAGGRSNSQYQPPTASTSAGSSTMTNRLGITSECTDAPVLQLPISRSSLLDFYTLR